MKLLGDDLHLVLLSAKMSSADEAEVNMNFCKIMCVHEHEGCGFYLKIIT